MISVKKVFSHVFIFDIFGPFPHSLKPSYVFFLTGKQNEHFVLVRMSGGWGRDARYVFLFYLSFE